MRFRFPSDKNISRLSVLFAVLTALLMLFLSTGWIVSKVDLLEKMDGFLPRLLLVLFITFLYIFFHYQIQRQDKYNFIDLLWKAFVTGMVCILISVAIRIFGLIFSGNMIMKSQVLQNFFLLIHIMVSVIFLLSVFGVWKRLILYQKNKQLQNFWRIYEYSLLFALLFDLTGSRFLDRASLFVVIFLLLQGLFLAFNLRWVAYLNFAQKWKAILFIVLIFIYLINFGNTLSSYTKTTLLFINVYNNTFLLSLYGFIFIYSIVSILVVLFNLPTSSVFEQKVKEVIDFQRLSQSISVGQSEQQIFEILLDSAMSSIVARAAWIEAGNDEVGLAPCFISRNLLETEILHLKSQMNNSSFQKFLDSDYDRNPSTRKFSLPLKNTDFKSVTVFPIVVKGKQSGMLCLLRDFNEPIDKESVDIINSFVNQACISVENFKLINEALENERYQEELKIASRVQKSLLPDQFEKHQDFDIVAFSKAADEVGGDYYDALKICENKYALIIADVSGKGTSAAFQMSQMKGVFHSLAQMDMNPELFMYQANLALSRCLEKTSFVTVSYFIIECENKKVTFARAGHCPTLLYQKKENKAGYFVSKGLGLGILRNQLYKNYVNLNEFHYESGDVLLLYTDGIVEATNLHHEQYGYDRLRMALNAHADKDLNQIKAAIIDDFYRFCDKDLLKDDYSMMIIKFK